MAEEYLQCQTRPLIIGSTIILYNNSNNAFSVTKQPTAEVTNLLPVYTGMHMSTVCVWSCDMRF